MFGWRKLSAVFGVSFCCSQAEMFEFDFEVSVLSGEMKSGCDDQFMLAPKLPVGVLKNKPEFIMVYATSLGLFFKKLLKKLCQNNLMRIVSLRNVSLEHSLQLVKTHDSVYKR